MRDKPKKTVSQTLERIARADDLELNEILKAVCSRHSVLFPQWELICLFLPKDDLKERQRLVDAAIPFLKEPGR